jgi:DNA-binding MarR family transcriptional regulator
MGLRFIPHVHRATHRIGRHIERLRSPAVNQGEAHILAHLAESGTSTIGEVHRIFAHKRSTLTSILDRLESRRLIVRTTDSRDRRTFRISLTPHGRRLARRVSSHLAAFEEQVLARASARDLQAFRRVLETLENVLDED